VEHVKIKAVDGMASRVDSFGLKDVLSLVFIQHGSCHLNECTILPFNHPIEGPIRPPERGGGVNGS
jgi:hypothetical protein